MNSRIPLKASDGGTKKATKNISVCICTYKRPELLRRLLTKLEELRTEDLFRYSVVVVDNDRAESARETAESCKRRLKISVSYHVEPEQNIALARNRAVENARGDFIAFIDDDEFPDEEWLLNLYKAFHEFRANVVLGPVKPYFETEPPEWIIRGRLCERESFPTGTIIRDGKHMRTGNALLGRELFVDNESLFNPLFGKTGGEDGDFFRRMLQKGNLFVWCNEACVNEIVPPERFRRSYFLKRALLQGLSFAKSRKGSLFSFDALKSVVAFLVYTPALLGLLLRHDLFMKYLIKDCYHLAKVLTLCGVRIMKVRTF
jgi:succinoglycan biosynthesis protein ExoM